MLWTSASHPVRIDWLWQSAEGRVGLTFAPGKESQSRSGPMWDRDLAADLDALSSAGATALVCLLEDHELAAVGIPDLVDAATRRGFEVIRLPIVDQQVPGSVAAVGALLDTSGRSIPTRGSDRTCSASR